MPSFVISISYLVLISSKTITFGIKWNFRSPYLCSILHNIQSYLKATEAESLISAHFHFIQFSSKTLQSKTPYFEANYFKTFFTKLYSYVLSAWFKLFIHFYRLLLLCRSVTNFLSHSFIYSVMNVINIYRPSSNSELFMHRS